MLNKTQDLNMNLDSIHRLIEETQIFQMQQSLIKSRSCTVAPGSSPKDTCNTCLPLHEPQSHATHNVCARSLHTNEWDICEELRLRELEEVKARAAQMEKTMRWWSDCTANWREKWSKVRAERNSAREESRQLRIKLEMAMKELNEQRKKQSPLLQKDPSAADVTRDLKPLGLVGLSSEHGDELPAGSQAWEHTAECLVRRQCSVGESGNNKENVVIDPLRLNEEMKSNLDSPDLFKKCGSGNCAVKPELRLQAINLPLEKEVTDMSTLQVHLDDFQKILWKERKMRAALEKQVAQLESELSLWKWKYEELNESEPPNVPEVERLQAENTLEWDKREKIEMEKQGPERENRRLKVQVKEMEEPLVGKCGASSNSQDPEFNTPQIEPQEKGKELLALQHGYYKPSRQYDAKMAELTHASNLLAEHEAEVKTLRFQVEELKQKLHQKEDELGDSLNQIHKLQKSLDEQKETNGNLEVEIKHLQNRWRKLEVEEQCALK
ncbi:coiled-coil domain-containing protein 102B isoform X2 [Ochotona princeps]|uniref:coiled-coil domain-containing protein 102B isoform X2 n=2 Tax=Ochotona princeps TaxID=9978 RepID=UPI002714AE1A|nr:coiled-coil domain-containing protein 102B isoform X2 [Ochotona princeps]